MLNKKILILEIFILLSGLLHSQIKVGQWRNHISYTDVLTLTPIENNIYAGTKLSLFSYDLNSGEYEKTSKINGLSEALIKVIKYHKDTKSLVIAYENSNIDIIKENTVYNFADIKRKQISGDKRINNITFRGDSIYFSCGFGIVIFDLKDKEFKDTYFIGEDAAFINVYDITFKEDSIFAATENGIYKANLNLTTLSDYRKWKRIKNIPGFNKTFNTICYSNGVLYTNQIDLDTEENENYKFSGEKWSIFNNEMKNLRSIVSKNGKTIFADKSMVLVYDEFENLERQVNWYTFKDTSSWLSVNYATLDGNNNLLIADERFGLVIHHNSGVLEKYYPNGPANNHLGKIINSGSKTYVTAGTKGSSAWHIGQYYTFSDEAWTSTKISNPDILDFHSITTDPSDQNKLYIGSWGTGLYEYQNNTLSETYDDFNSTLSYVDDQMNISSVKFDRQGNLWVANSGVAMPVSVRTTDNQWYSYNFQGKINGEGTNDFLITSFGDIWLVLEHNGLFAFNPNGTPETDADDEYEKFSPVDEEGTVISNVYSIAEDKTGEIWVGTDEGPLIYYSPENVFTGDNFYADRIQLTAYGNDTTEQYLLETETITSIAVDGANQKWLGTLNSGVYLVSEDGKETIYTFNKDNSPLLSNTIIDISINSLTGEVFFGTDKGIVSYRGEAIEGKSYYNDVFVFPNPVRPDYTGKITITGLLEETNVKITDVSGQIVFETESLGGQAIWDGNDFNNNRVGSGVYVIFCTTKTGEQTYTGKLLFLN